MSLVYHCVENVGVTETVHVGFSGTSVVRMLVLLTLYVLLSSKWADCAVQAQCGNLIGN